MLCNPMLVVFFAFGQCFPDDSLKIDMISGYKSSATKNSDNINNNFIKKENEKDLSDPTCPTERQIIDAGGEVNLINCIFNGFSSRYVNGSVICANNGCTSLIENCEFSVCKCEGFDIVDPIAFGGCCYFAKSDVTYRNCSFNKCLANAGGGSLSHFSSTVEVIDCKFYQSQSDYNFISGQGGGLYNEFCSCHYQKCEFIECDGLDSGGGFEHKNCMKSHIENCLIDKCTSDYGTPGCLIQNGAEEPIIFDSCTFKECKVTASIELLKGDDMSTVTFDFDDNHISPFACEIKNCLFTALECFAILCEAMNLTLIETNFTNITNNIQDHSSCIHCLFDSIDHGFYTLNNSIFDKCVTQDYGMINIPHVSLDMNSCHITNCRSLDNYEKDGHGFMITDDDSSHEEVFIRVCVFENNEAYSAGSGLYIDRKEKDITITNCSFINNQVLSLGSDLGCNLHIESKSTSATFNVVRLIGCRFDYQKKNMYPSIFIGVIHEMVINGCCFNSTGNIETTIYHIVSKTLITFDDNNCFNDVGSNNFEFVSNQDTSSLHFDCVDCVAPTSFASETPKPTSDPTCPTERQIIDAGGEVNLINCIFNGFSSSYVNGSVICANNGCTSLIENCEFSVCRCEGFDIVDPIAFGGCCYFAKSVVTYRNCSFNKCLANAGGGSLSHFSSTVEVIDCKFYQSQSDYNFISGQGGGLYNEFCSCHYQKCEFIECDGLDSGGGFEHKNCMKSHIEDCLFEKCTSDYGTPGCLIQNGAEEPIIFDSCTFKECKVTAEPYYMTGDDMSTVTFDFDDNHISPFACEIRNCLFTALECFAILCEAMNLTLIETNFTNITNNIQDHSSCIHCLLDSIDHGFYTLNNSIFDKCVTQDYGMINIPHVSLDMNSCHITNCRSLDNYEKDGHGFMITDDDSSHEEVFIRVCVFENNEAYSAGSGLYIDRKEKDITITNCSFINNQVLSLGSDLGCNLHIESKSTSATFNVVRLIGCRFDYQKKNMYPSIFIGVLHEMVMNGCCFNSTGNIETTIYHIVSKTLITFDDNNCFNDVGSNNFEFISNQETSSLHFDCVDCVVPIGTMTTDIKEQTSNPTTEYQSTNNIQSQTPIASRSPIPTVTRSPIPTVTRSPIPTVTRSPIPTVTRSPIPTASRIKTPERTMEITKSAHVSQIRTTEIIFVPDDSQQNVRDKKLKGGEIAGIVIGCLVFAVAVIVVTLIFVRKQTVTEQNNSDVYNADNSMSAAESSSFANAEVLFDDDIEDQDL